MIHDDDDDVFLYYYKGQYLCIIYLIYNVHPLCQIGAVPN